MSLIEARTSAADYVELLHPEIRAIRVFATVEEAARAAADFITTTVMRNPNATISYATGETMKPVYATVAKAVSNGLVDFRDSSAFHLDERWPCPPAHPASFARFILERVVIPFHIPNAQVSLIDGAAADPQAEAERYNALLRRHQVDLAILGLAPNGHIAFNEPGTPFETETHYVERLAAETVRRDRRERGEDTPDGAITQGIANILRAKQILLIAYGAEKGDALVEALYRPISPECPASALRTQGEKLHIFVDQAAAAQLILKP